MEFLSEDAFKQHADMFRLVPEDRMEAWSHRTREVVEIFKGNRARLIWALRWHRIWLFTKEGDTPPPQYTRGMDNHWASASELHMLLPFFQHIFTVPYPPIHEYNWDHKKVPNEVRGDLDALERTFKEAKPKEVEAKTEDDVVVEFPDGFRWVDLNRANCDEEGRAMGHCGNGNADDGTILSLRKKLASGRFVPHLTFILEDDGMLGEMKGRANKRPSEKYHPYIIELLIRHRPIKGLKGGGYLPESNFDLSDLPSEQLERLFKERPDFERPVWYLIEQGDVNAAAKIVGLPYHEEQQAFLVGDLDFDGYYDVHKGAIRREIAHVGPSSGLDAEEVEACIAYWLEKVEEGELMLAPSLRFRRPLRNVVTTEVIGEKQARVWIPVDKMTTEVVRILDYLRNDIHSPVVSNLITEAGTVAASMFLVYGQTSYPQQSSLWLERPMGTRFMVRDFKQRRS
jgi:hypothetical protein